MNTTLFISVIALIGFTILFVRAKRKRQRHHDAIESYVSAIFTTQTYRPEVNTGFTYGIPTFSLKFNTDKEKQHAISNGFIDQILDSVQELCGHLRPRGEVFKAARAVSIFSTQDEERWAKEATDYREKESE